jgi:integrase
MEYRLKLYRGQWSAVWREDGQTKRRSLRTADRASAQRTLEALRLAVPAGNTVSQVYAAYLGAKGTTRAVWAWAQLNSSFGEMVPAQVNRTACQAYTKKRRAAGVSDGTIHTELTFLRAALRFADKNTPAEIVLPPKPPPQERYLTHAEYDRLVAAATTPHVRLFIILALATAGRMTAILELTWDRIDFERGIIRLGKGEKRRKGRATVPMTDRAKAELTAAAKARTSDYVIEYAGRNISRIHKAFMAAAIAAGLPDCTPHVLRHTAAVWMAEAGTPIPEIAQYLGHTDSRITERVYSRFSPQYLRHASRALER